MERAYDVAAPQWRAILPPPNAAKASTFRQQIDSLPACIVSVWRSRHANEGTEMEACAIIDRKAAATRAEGEIADVQAIWMRQADVAGQTRNTPPALLAAAALAGLAPGIRTQGFEAPTSTRAELDD